MRRSICAGLLAVLCHALPSPAATSLSAVSPGAFGRATPTSPCPTFSWASPGRPGFGLEIAVFTVAPDGAISGEPTLRQPVAPGASSWTPPADRCLQTGTYAWTIRAVDPAGELTWSEFRLFTVAVPDTGADLERAVERVLERWLAEGRLGEGAAVARDLVRHIADAPSEPSGDGSGKGSPSFIAETALFDPPDCTAQNQMFTDVPFGDSRCQFIQQFSSDQISTQCAAGRFCPDDPVTRGQLAVFMERAMRGTTTWSVDADLLDGIDSSSFARRDAANTFTAANTFPGSGIWGSNGRVGIGTTSPATPLDIQFAASQKLQFRYDSNLVPGINVNTTSNPGILRLRNAMEVWPSDDASRAGKIDVRNTAGAAKIVLNGATGDVTANNLAAYAGTALVFDPVAFSDWRDAPDLTDLVLDSLTVTAPSSGQILLFATAQLGGNNSAVYLRIEEVASPNVKLVEYITNVVAGPITMFWSVPTSAGQRTFRTVIFDTLSDTRVGTSTLRAVFVPNAF